MESLYQTINRIGQIQKSFASWKPNPSTTEDIPTQPPKAVTSTPPLLEFFNSSDQTSYPFADLVSEASEKYDLPDSLIKSVIQVESNFDEDAVSPKGAMGLMQLMPKTAEQYRVNEPYSPLENIDAGSKHLRKLLNRYNGNLIKALAAYNAGENSFKDNLVPNYRETQNYIKKVLKNYMKYNGVDL